MNSYFGQPLLKDYADCERMFSTARHPERVSLYVNGVGYTRTKMCTS